MSPLISSHKAELKGIVYPKKRKENSVMSLLTLMAFRTCMTVQNNNGPHWLSLCGKTNKQKTL